MISIQIPTVLSYTGHAWYSSVKVCLVVEGQFSSNCSQTEPNMQKWAIDHLKSEFLKIKISNAQYVFRSPLYYINLLSDMFQF